MKPEEVYKKHELSLITWLREERDYRNRKEMMDTFIKEYNLPEDITIGELLAFCEQKQKEGDV